MFRRPPRSTRTDTLFPYTTLFRSTGGPAAGGCVMTPDIISEAEAANELMRLAKVIARHNRLYHTEDSPEISDADYDALIRRNAEMEAKFPHLIRGAIPSRQVGAVRGGTPRGQVRQRRKGGGQG